MLDEIKREDWINVREINSLRRTNTLTPPESRLDVLVSKVVGKPVAKADPRLIRLVVKWKNEADIDPNGTDPYNFLKDKEKVAELRRTFGSSKTGPV